MNNNNSQRINNNIVSEIPEENLPSVEIGNPDEKTMVIGVKFQNSGKVYYFSPSDIEFTEQEHAIVQTARGLEYGLVVKSNQMVSNKDIVPPLRPIVRKATKEDDLHAEQNRLKEKDAFSVCLEKIAFHKLEMKLIDAEFTFDNTKLVFYFSAEGRVDFRDLVKDLASVFHTRIELRQIGIRDEAKILGGLGVCGLPFCCSTFLSDFAQVSIKMAKEQNLSLNSSKISGTCGRLMCCLRYESEVYEEGLRLSPSVDSKVKTPEGIGIVTEVNPLTGMCKISIRDNANNECIKYYHRDQLTILSRSKHRDNTPNSTSEFSDTIPEESSFS